MHRNIAVTVSAPNGELRQARLAPKSRTTCTLGFVSSRAFLVIHPFGHAHKIKVVPTPRACQLMYVLYIRVAVSVAFS